MYSINSRSIHLAGWFKHNRPTLKYTDTTHAPSGAI